jgi:AAA ATPase domain
MARRVSSPQIVGRDETLAALEAALARAIQADPGVVLLAGEAGVGKTRVARELAEREGDARFLVRKLRDEPVHGARRRTAARPRSRRSPASTSKRPLPRPPRSARTI